ncbi:hypothetical protein AC578_6620 [Pseudocercospora eumusae]|uniref:Uncharacterized protein n=1 Tax=Pseudocercospora eumusae TaxID=321146 RepID=A0A139HG34_9PEZI|nr:hypothetical protein AC578_6620 [Pseudocercospora eumusae]
MRWDKIFIAILTGYGMVVSLTQRHHQAEGITFNIKKVVTPQWHNIFLRGIGSRIFLEGYGHMVVYLCIRGIVIGLDHVVANKFFVPVAIWRNDSQIIVGLYYIWKSMVPALSGNIVGGALFIAAAFWYLLRKTHHRSSLSKTPEQRALTLFHSTSAAKMPCQSMVSSMRLTGIR